MRAGLWGETGSRGGLGWDCKVNVFFVGLQVFGDFFSIFWGGWGLRPLGLSAAGGRGRDRRGGKEAASGFCADGGGGGFLGEAGAVCFIFVWL